MHSHLHTCLTVVGEESTLKFISVSDLNPELRLPCRLFDSSVCEQIIPEKSRKCVRRYSEICYAGFATA